jgi:hypothetical protein
MKESNVPNGTTKTQKQPRISLIHANNQNLHQFVSFAAKRSTIKSQPQPIHRFEPEIFMTAVAVYVFH